LNRKWCNLSTSYFSVHFTLICYYLTILSSIDLLCDFVNAVLSALTPLPMSLPSKCLSISKFQTKYLHEAFRDVHFTMFLNSFLILTVSNKISRFEDCYVCWRFPLNTSPNLEVLNLTTFVKSFLLYKVICSGCGHVYGQFSKEVVKFYL
jgi:hypothetical protein